MLQCHNLRVDRGYYTGDIAQAVVSSSQRSRDCWCLRFIPYVLIWIRYP